MSAIGSTNSRPTAPKATEIIATAAPPGIPSFQMHSLLIPESSPLRTTASFVDACNAFLTKNLGIGQGHRMLGAISWPYTLCPLEVFLEEQTTHRGS